MSRSLGIRATKQNDFARMIDANGTVLRVTVVPKIDCWLAASSLGRKVTGISAAVRAWPPRVRSVGVGSRLPLC